MLVRFTLGFDALDFVEHNDEWYQNDEGRKLFGILYSLKDVTKKISSLEELKDILVSIDECEYNMTYAIYPENKNTSLVVVIDFV